MRNVPRIVLRWTAVPSLLIALWFVWPRPPKLMDRARKVASVKGWMIDRGPDACMAWGWISDRELIFLRQNGPRPAFYRHDIVTGVESSIPALTKLFLTTGADPDGIQVAPDGQYVLWNGYHAEDGRIVGARIDGGEFFRGPNGLRGFARWLGDSRHWFELGMKVSVFADARICSIAAGGSSARINIRAAHPINNSSSYGGNEIVRGIQGSCDRILTNDWSYRAITTSTRVSISELNLASGFSPTRTYSVQIPQGRYACDVITAPRGDQIAWKFAFENHEGVIDVLSRWLPRFRAPCQTVALYVSSVNGSNMHDLGRMESIDNKSDEVFMREPDYIKWTPDGKHLSFIYRDSLYLVSTE